MVTLPIISGALALSAVLFGLAAAWEAHICRQEQAKASRRQHSLMAAEYIRGLDEGSRIREEYHG